MKRENISAQGGSLEREATRNYLIQARCRLVLSEQYIPGPQVEFAACSRWQLGENITQHMIEIITQLNETG